METIRAHSTKVIEMQIIFLKDNPYKNLGSFL